VYLSSVFNSILLSALLLTSIGCKPSTPGVNLSNSYVMGEKARVGAMTYTVIDSDWKPELTGSKEPPKNRFLILRVSMTNGGGKEVSLPLFKIRTSTGKEYTEFSDLEGTPEWLGLFRRIKPAGTEEGIVVFDVPLAEYFLEIHDGGEPGDDRISHVRVPLNLAPTPASPTSPLPQ
jgi:hypothetical protein